MSAEAQCHPQTPTSREGLYEYDAEATELARGENADKLRTTQFVRQFTVTASAWGATFRPKTARFRKGGNERCIVYDSPLGPEAKAKVVVMDIGIKCRFPRLERHRNLRHRVLLALSQGISGNVISPIFDNLKQWLTMINSQPALDLHLQGKV